MAMPDESSVFCDGCSGYNIQCGSIIEIDNNLYCEICIERFGLKRELEALKKKLRNKLKELKNETTISRA